MRIWTFIKSCVIQFFVISTCVTFATAVAGPYLMPDVELGFTAFYSPLAIGFVCTLPSVVLYSRKELNLKQTIIRRVLHLLLIEVLVIWLNWMSGNLETFTSAAGYCVKVLAVYLAVHLVLWFLGSRDAKQINAGLKELQGRE